MTYSSNPRIHTVWMVISTLVALIALAVACVAIYQLRVARHEMVLVDQAGRERVRFTATNEGGTIELIDERGRVRIALRQLSKELSMSMHWQEPPSDGSADFAMQYLVQEGANTNQLEMRTPADRTAITLGGQHAAFLSLNHEVGSAAFSVSKLGTLFHLHHLEKDVTLSLEESRAHVSYGLSRLKLDDVFLPRKIDSARDEQRE